MVFDLLNWVVCKICQSRHLALLSLFCFLVASKVEAPVGLLYPCEGHAHGKLRAHVAALALYDLRVGHAEYCPKIAAIYDKVDLKPTLKNTRNFAQDTFPAREAARDLLQINPNISCVHGPNWSDAAAEVAKLYQLETPPIPVLLSAATAPMFSNKNKYPNVFRVTTSDGLLAQAMHKLLTELGSMHVIAVLGKGSFPQGLGDELKQLTERGQATFLSRSYDDIDALRGQVQWAAQQAADVLLLAGNGDEDTYELYAACRGAGLHQRMLIFGPDLVAGGSPLDWGKKTYGNAVADKVFDRVVAFRAASTDSNTFLSNLPQRIHAMQQDAEAEDLMNMLDAEDCSLLGDQFTVPAYASEYYDAIVLMCAAYARPGVERLQDALILESQKGFECSKGQFRLDENQDRIFDIDVYQFEGNEIVLRKSFVVDTDSFQEHSALQLPDPFAAPGIHVILIILGCAVFCAVLLAVCCIRRGWCPHKAPQPRTWRTPADSQSSKSFPKQDQAERDADSQSSTGFKNQDKAQRDAVSKLDALTRNGRLPAEAQGTADDLLRKCGEALINKELIHQNADFQSCVAAALFKFAAKHGSSVEWRDQAGCVWNYLQRYILSVTSTAIAAEGADHLLEHLSIAIHEELCLHDSTIRWYLSVVSKLPKEQNSKCYERTILKLLERFAKGLDDELHGLILRTLEAESNDYPFADMTSFVFASSNDGLLIRAIVEFASLRFLINMLKPLSPVEQSNLTAVLLSTVASKELTHIKETGVVNSKGISNLLDLLSHLAQSADGHKILALIAKKLAEKHRASPWSIVIANHMNSPAHFAQLACQYLLHRRVTREDAIDFKTEQDVVKKAISLVKESTNHCDILIEVVKCLEYDAAWNWQTMASHFDALLLAVAEKEWDRGASTLHQVAFCMCLGRLFRSGAHDKPQRKNAWDHLRVRLHQLHLHRVTTDQGAELLKSFCTVEVLIDAQDIAPGCLDYLCSLLTSSVYPAWFGTTALEVVLDVLIGQAQPHFLCLLNAPRASQKDCQRVMQDMKTVITTRRLGGAVKVRLAQRLAEMMGKDGDGSRLFASDEEFFDYIKALYPDKVYYKFYGTTWRTKEEVCSELIRFANDNLNAALVASAAAFLGTAVSSDAGQISRPDLSVSLNHVA